MVLAISLLTVSQGAFYVSFFMHNFGWGFLAAFIVHVVYFMIHGAGFILPTDQILVNYFWSTFFFAVLGWALAFILRSPALLNGIYYRKVFSKEHHARKHKEKEDPDYPDLPVEGKVKENYSASRAFLKFLIPFLIVIAAHIVYELNIDGFPKWLGGLILSLVTLGAWVLFFFLFRDKDNQRSVMFNSRDPNREVATIAFHLIIINVSYSLIYWIFQLADCGDWSGNAPNVTVGGTKCGLFIDDQWYFLISLLTGVGATIYIFVIWMVIRGTRTHTDVAYEYKGLKTNTQ